MAADALDAGWDDVIEVQIAGPRGVVVVHQLATAPDGSRAWFVTTNPLEAPLGDGRHDPDLPSAMARARGVAGGAA
jgi:hypothetical protein